MNQHLRPPEIISLNADDHCDPQPLSPSVQYELETVDDDTYYTVQQRRRSLTSHSNHNYAHNSTFLDTGVTDDSVKQTSAENKVSSPRAGFDHTSTHLVHSDEKMADEGGEGGVQLHPKLADKADSSTLTQEGGSSEHVEEYGCLSDIESDYGADLDELIADDELSETDDEGKEIKPADQANGGGAVMIYKEEVNQVNEKIRKESYTEFTDDKESEANRTEGDGDHKHGAMDSQHDPCKHANVELGEVEDDEMPSKKGPTRKVIIVSWVLFLLAVLSWAFMGPSFLYVQSKGIEPVTGAMWRNQCVALIVLIPMIVENLLYYRWKRSRVLDFPLRPRLARRGRMETIANSSQPNEGQVQDSGIEVLVSSETRTTRSSSEGNDGHSETQPVNKPIFTCGKSGSKHSRWTWVTDFDDIKRYQDYKAARKKRRWLASRQSDQTQRSEYPSHNGSEKGNMTDVQIINDGATEQRAIDKGNSTGARTEGKTIVNQESKANLVEIELTVYRQRNGTEVSEPHGATISTPISLDKDVGMNEPSATTQSPTHNPCTSLWRALCSPLSRFYARWIHPIVNRPLSYSVLSGFTWVCSLSLWVISLKYTTTVSAALLSSLAPIVLVAWYKVKGTVISRGMSLLCRTYLHHFASVSVSSSPMFVLIHIAITIAALCHYYLSILTLDSNSSLLPLARLSLSLFIPLMAGELAGVFISFAGVAVCVLSSKIASAASGGSDSDVPAPPPPQTPPDSSGLSWVLHHIISPHLDSPTLPSPTILSSTTQDSSSTVLKQNTFEEELLGAIMCLAASVFIALGAVCSGRARKYVPLFTHTFTSTLLVATVMALMSIAFEGATFSKYSDVYEVMVLNTTSVIPSHLPPPITPHPLQGLPPLFTSLASSSEIVIPPTKQLVNTTADQGLVVIHSSKYVPERWIFGWIDERFIALIFGLGLLGGMIGLVGFNMAVKYLSSLVYTVIQLLDPFITGFISNLLGFEEPPTWPLYLGGIILTGGIGLLVVSEYRRIGSETKAKRAQSLKLRKFKQMRRRHEMLQGNPTTTLIPEKTEAVTA